MLCILFGIWCAYAHPAKPYDLMLTYECQGWDANDDGEEIMILLHKAHATATPGTYAAAASTEGATIWLEVTGKFCFIDKPIVLAPWFDLNWDTAPPIWKDYRTREEYQAAMKKRASRASH